MEQILLSIFLKQGNISVSFLLLWFEKPLWQKQLKGERVYLSSQFQVTVDHNREATAAAGVENNWSHHIPSQAAESYDVYLFIHTVQEPNQEMLPP